MKVLAVSSGQLIDEQRWDIDFHLPPVEISKFQQEILTYVGNCVTVITEKRNPTLLPEKNFLYIDISSIDITTGIVMSPRELLGEEAPSRARKVVREGDIIISTCRPTRGAIAIIPKELDNQICSTGFSVIRAKDGINNQYLHFVLRSNSTKEQFRKWSTGSSYPAILDDDVVKTQIPLPSKPIQDSIAQRVYEITEARNKKINEANAEWKNTMNRIMSRIMDNDFLKKLP